MAVHLKIPADRYRKMMELIPRWPGSITTRDLGDALANHGFEVSLRTVQRNLNEIYVNEDDIPKRNQEFGLDRKWKEPELPEKGQGRKRKEAKPRTESGKVENENEKDQEKKQQGGDYEYFFRADAPMHITPSLNDDMALALQLANTYLTELMPPASLEALTPIFRAAEKRLLDGKRITAARWNKKIHVVPFGVRRKAPRINDQVRATVYQAVMEDKPLRFRYSTAEKKPGEFLMMPWGLVVRNQAIYLLCHGPDKGGTYPFALHRMSEVEIATVEPGKKFFSNSEWDSLKDYAENKFGYSVAKRGEKAEIDIELRIYATWLAVSLEESPLLERQRIALDPSDASKKNRILTTTVQNTMELRHWIRSLGADVEVLSPPSLREEMANEANTLAERYKQRKK